MNPTGRTARWARRGCALAVACLGVADLALAARSAPPRHAGFLAVDYVAAAVVGARYGLVATGVAALLAVRALLHGKRAAWWLALTAAALSLPSHHITDSDDLGLISSAATIAVLLAGRRAFVARSDPALARRGVAVLLGGELIVFGYAAIGMYLLDEPHFPTHTTLRATPGDAARLLFLLPVRREPVTAHGRWFVDSVRVGALMVAIAGLAWLVATVVGRPGHGRDRALVEQLLQRHGRTALAHFHLLDDKAWLLSPDGRAFIGYKVIGTTAVALGEPVGEPASALQAALDFLRLCSLNGWTPVFHQVTEDGRKLLAQAGLKSLKIGEEAIVDVRSFTLDGRAHRGVRQAVRRVERAGYRVVDLPVTADTLPRLRAVSDAWLASAGHRERTFTLGRFDPEYLRATPIVAVVDAHDEIQAFANVLPSYHCPDGTFDLMRRRPESVNGVMDYLFVKLIERFAAQGHAGMNLGLAPLAGSDDDSLPGRALRLLYERGGRAFNFAGLYAFKDKWGPRWEPRYLLYRSDAELPKAAAAVARAGELPDPRNPLVRAAAVMRRFPFTTAFAALQLWLMTADTWDARLHHRLRHNFGLSWADLAHGHLWRLATSPLIQARPGFVFTNLSLLILIVPLAERLLGGRRTAITFFAGDWASTVPVLIGLRIAAALGVGGAASLATSRDLGTSSGMWSLAAAAAASLPGRWPRRVATGVVLGVLIWYLIDSPQLFAVQHLISATAVTCAYWWLRRRTATASPTQ